MKAGIIAMSENPLLAQELAVSADEGGVHSVWSIDYYNRSSLARAAAFAASTEQITIGTSIAPLFARAALATAAAVADIQVISRGRFVFGVGTSTRRMNHDWYDVELDHPAPRTAERIQLVRSMLRHPGGRFEHHGRFDNVTMAHFDREALIPETPIIAAGVGHFMIDAAGRHADGFVGHTIASADYLANIATPRLAGKVEESGRSMSDFMMTSQVIASVDPDRAKARRAAAIQTAFYATVKGYDALFPDDQFGAERLAAREAFAVQDLDGMERAGLAMVDERAVYGTVDEVADQLKRYESALDVAVLYSPHYGIPPEEIHANEMALVEVAKCWTR